MGEGSMQHAHTGKYPYPCVWKCIILTSKESGVGNMVHICTNMYLHVLFILYIQIGN